MSERLDGRNVQSGLQQWPGEGPAVLVLHGWISYAGQLGEMIAGLRYAFPRAMARLTRGHPLLDALHDKIAALPRVAAYLASTRRIPFNQQGIFRHYPELDARPARKAARKSLK